MIDDGYTETVTIESGEFKIRRFLSHELEGFVSSKVPTYELWDMVVSRVVSGPFVREYDHELMREVLGFDDRGRESSDIRNLSEGVMLHLRNPEVSGRDCGSCRKWWYSSSGKIVTDRDGNPRPRQSVLPCETHAGCPKGTYDNPIDLSEKNRKAYNHYRVCKAVMSFPDDPIVKRNAVIISECEERWFWEKLNGLVERD